MILRQSFCRPQIGPAGRRVDWHMLLFISYTTRHRTQNTSHAGQGIGRLLAAAQGATPTPPLSVGMAHAKQGAMSARVTSETCRGTHQKSHQRQEGYAVFWR